MKNKVLILILLFSIIGCSEGFNIDLTFGDSKSESDSVNLGIDNAFASTYLPMDSEPILFKSANIYDGLGGEFRNYDLLLSEGKIIEIGESISAPGVFDQAEIPIMFSTQRSHNYHLMRQGAGNAVAYGMSYETAIKGMSNTVAQTFRLNNRGSIEVGKLADIVVWDGDPLEPSSFPKMVMIEGQLQDLSSRSSRLTERYTNTENKPSSYKH